MLSHLFEAKSLHALADIRLRIPILFALKFLPILRSPEDRVGDVGITQPFLMGLSKPIAQLLGIRAVTLHEFIFNRCFLWGSATTSAFRPGFKPQMKRPPGVSGVFRIEKPRFWILSGRSPCSRCTFCRCLNTLEFAARWGVTTQQGGAKAVSWERKERGEGDLNDENGKWSGFKSPFKPKRPVISQGPTSLHGQVLCPLDSLRSLRRDCKKS